MGPLNLGYHVSEESEKLFAAAYIARIPLTCQHSRSHRAIHGEDAVKGLGVSLTHPHQNQ